MTTLTKTSGRDGSGEISEDLDRRSIKVSQSVKYELERIQDEIKRSERLSARPSLSDVIDRLIQSRHLDALPSIPQS